MGRITSICATIPQGAHRELWYHGAGCHAWLVVTRDLSHAMRFWRSSSRAGRCHERAIDLPSGGLIDRRQAARVSRFDGKTLFRALPAIRWPRRCWPMASRWSGAVSNITGRAAFSRRVGGAERAGGVARGRAARAEYARDDGGVVRGAGGEQPEPVSLAEIRSAGGQFELLSPFLAAGFYYKTFMWPASFWEKIYEPLIRRAAGLGRNAGVPDPDVYEKSTMFCDVLVIGGGEAGIAAALAAGRAGGRVVLCDENACSRRAGAVGRQSHRHGGRWRRRRISRC